MIDRLLSLPYPIQTSFALLHTHRLPHTQKSASWARQHALHSLGVDPADLALLKHAAVRAPADIG